MVALICAFGDFHIAQESVHLGDGQAAIGTHRAVASHGAQELVALSFNYATGWVIGQILEQTPDQFNNIATCKQGRYAAHSQLTRSGSGNFKTQLSKTLLMVLDRGKFGAIGR